MTDTTDAPSARDERTLAAQAKYHEVMTYAGPNATKPYYDDTGVVIRLRRVRARVRHHFVILRLGGQRAFVACARGVGRVSHASSSSRSPRRWPMIPSASSATSRSRS